MIGLDAGGLLAEAGLSVPGCGGGNGWFGFGWFVWWSTVCGAVDALVVVPDGVVGSGPGADPVGGHGEGPVAFVYEVVVGFAQWEEFVEVGSAAERPWDDVVDSAVVEGDLAVGVGAGAVHGSQCASLGPVGGALLASDVECFAVGSECDRVDRGVAAHALHR